MAIIPFDDRDGVIWMDGKIIPWRDAKVHVLTHGLHYGSCVFEGERAYGGQIFKTTEHSIRFRKSAEIMDFEIPYSVEELNAAKDEVVRLNGGGDQYVRPVAWRGSEMMAVSAQHNKIHVAIATWVWPSMFDMETKMKGIRLDLAEYRRPDPACAPVHAKAADAGDAARDGRALRDAVRAPRHRGCARHWRPARRCRRSSWMTASAPTPLRGRVVHPRRRALAIRCRPSDDRR